MNLYAGSRIQPGRGQKAIIFHGHLIIIIIIIIITIVPIPKQNHKP